MNSKSEILQKNIIIELGLENLPEDRKIDLLSKMSDLIQKRVLLMVIRSLSASDKEEFNSLLGKDDIQEIYKFLISKVPNIDEITDEEVIKFKEEIITHVKNLNV